MSYRSLSKIQRSVCFAVGLLAIAAGAATAVAADRCEGQTFAVTNAPGGLSPYIRLQADRVSGAFLLDYGSTRSSLSTEAFRTGAITGTGNHDIRSFSLPTFARGRFQLAQYGLVREPPGGQLGIVGTDFLSKLTADFVFSAGGGDVVLGLASCDPLLLRRRGMVAISQAGFFSSNVDRVRRDLPNVPVLRVRLGHVEVWAQVDTGYDDAAFPPSIDINEALYRRIADDVGLAKIGAVTVTTCRGTATRDVYESHGMQAAIVTDDGALLRELRDVRLVRKAAAGCGGIAGLSEPAAQLGVSVLRQLGSVVFDPNSERVWVPAGPERSGE